MGSKRQDDWGNDIRERLGLASLEEALADGFTPLGKALRDPELAARTILGSGAP